MNHKLGHQVGKVKEPYRTHTRSLARTGPGDDRVRSTAWPTLTTGREQAPASALQSLWAALRQLQAELGDPVTGPALLVGLAPMVHHSALVGK